MPHARWISIWCVASVSRQSLRLATLKWNLCHAHPSVLRHSLKGTHAQHACIHIQHKYILTCTCTYLQRTSNIRLTGIQQDDSEDGHSKEKNNNGKNSTECNHSWEEVSWSLVSTFRTRPCGVGFKVNDKLESI